MGGDIAGQVAEHDEDGTPEQSGAEHGTGVPGGQLRTMPLERERLMSFDMFDTQGNNNNHTQPVVNRLTLLLNCELSFNFTIMARLLIYLSDTPSMYH